MTVDQSEALKRECTLALARYLEQDPKAADPYHLFCFAFFAGVDAQVLERNLVDVDAELALVRARRGIAVEQRSADESNDEYMRHARDVGLVK